MVDIAQCKLEQLVCKNRSRVGKSKQGMVREHSAKAHGPGMKNSFMAETTQAGMPVDNLDLLANDNVPENGEEGENRRHSGLAVYNEERDVVDLESIGKVADPGASFVGMGNDDHFVASVNKFLGSMSIEWAKK